MDLRSLWPVDEMARLDHHDRCEAPICQEEMSPFAIWYPDEPVCNIKTRAHVRAVQMRIQKLYKRGKLKYGGHFLTGPMLEEITRVTPQTRGRNPGREYLRWPLWGDDPPYNKVEKR